MHAILRCGFPECRLDSKSVDRLNENAEVVVKGLAEHLAHYSRCALGTDAGSTSPDQERLLIETASGGWAGMSRERWRYFGAAQLQVTHRIRL